MGIEEDNPWFLVQRQLVPGGLIMPNEFSSKVMECWDKLPQAMRDMLHEREWYCNLVMHPIYGLCFIVSKEIALEGALVGYIVISKPYVIYSMQGAIIALFD